MSNEQEYYIFTWKDLTYEKFLLSLKNSWTFREKIINLFKNFNKFDQVYWEFPYYNVYSKNNIAEFVLVKAPPFPHANPSKFKTYLDRCSTNDEVIDFPNLSFDTRLIIPSNNTLKGKHSGHIMDFMKNGSEKQVHNFLEHVAKLMLMYSEFKNKIYLSTHGNGVPWVHMRICSQPKYYSFVRYAQA